MKRLFLSITKGEELRFLGHLDFLRTMERAVMRSEIPVAFSEGFNPHMKLSLDSALGVGVTADPLYLEITIPYGCPSSSTSLSAPFPDFAFKSFLYCFNILSLSSLPFFLL